MDDEQATIESQYYEFSKYLDSKRSGLTITIFRSDFWMRQAKILDDRKITMTDTGVLFFRWQKTELEYDEWLQFLEDLCSLKELDLEFVKDTLTNCGIPGQTPVVVPQYRDFFLTFKPREKGIIHGELGRVSTIKSLRRINSRTIYSHRLVIEGTACPPHRPTDIEYERQLAEELNAVCLDIIPMEDDETPPPLPPRVPRLVPRVWHRDPDQEEPLILREFRGYRFEDQNKSPRSRIFEWVTLPAIPSKHLRKEN